MSRILPAAIILEAFKWLLLLLAANNLPLANNEFLNAVFAITMWVLMLPEMLVSYEQGPHGILAGIVMFSAGTIANVLLIGLAISIRRSIKGENEKSCSKAQSDA